MRRWFTPVFFGLALSAFVLFARIPYETPFHSLLMRLRGPIQPRTSVVILTLETGPDFPTERAASRKIWFPKVQRLLEALNNTPPNALELVFPVESPDRFALEKLARTYPFFTRSYVPPSETLLPKLSMVSSPEFVERPYFEITPDAFMSSSVELPLLEHLAPERVLELRSGRPEILNFLGPPAVFPHASVDDLLADPSKLASLRDKILLVSPPRDLRYLRFESALVFREKSGKGWNRAEILANVVETVVGRQGLRFPPGWFSALLTTSVTLLTVLVLFGTAPLLGILSIIFLTALLFLAGIVALNFHWYLDIHKSLAAILLAYYFLIPYRLIVEYKGRWKYQQENKLLAEVETLKDNFMSLVSHNLKTPIARIEGTIETLLAAKTPDPEGVRSELLRVLESTGDLNRFISRILNLTRIERPEYQIHAATGDLNDLVGKVVENHRPAAAGKKMELKASLEPLFPIRMDAELIGESVANLVENAIKYTPAGGSVQVSTGEDGDSIFVRVEDTGPGIHRDDAGRIFSKFYRGTDVKNKGLRGTGLGLYLAKYFVELHGGTVGFENRPEGGTTFTIQLPRM